LNVYKDKEWNIISEESQILKSWVEYYKDLLNKGESKLEEEYICCPRCLTAQPKLETPTLEEVEIAMLRMKNSKAPGEDSITIQLIKNGVKIYWKEYIN
jgi:hypothetical protein